MRSNMKIALNNVKILYSVSFILILALVRGIVHVEEILPALDTSMALLAIVFCADGYYQEIHEKRWEVFFLLPEKKRYQAVLQRLGIQMAALFLLTAVAFWLFLIQSPQNLTDADMASIYIWTIINCFFSMFFLGTLSFSLVNLFRNVWLGIGLSFSVWALFNSTVNRFIPEWINLFPYSNMGLAEVTGHLMIGKLFYGVSAIVLLILNRLVISQNRKVG